MSDTAKWLGGYWINSAAALSSRVLGLLRDIATASLLGLEAGGVMDAFAVAFRLPNVIRRLLADGALAAGYLPAFSAAWERDPAAARQLATGSWWRLAQVLAWLGLLAGLCLAIAAGVWREQPATLLVLGLSAALIPYSICTCLAAQQAATLQGLDNFLTPAVAALWLNLCWLAGAWWIAPWLTPDPHRQAYVLTAAIGLGGGLQMLAQWPALWRAGFRSVSVSKVSAQAERELLSATGLVVLGLLISQATGLVESYLAWLLAAAHEGQTLLTVAGWQFEYPLRTGAAATLYFAERVYQFPLGLIGIALATAVFPILTRHRARGDAAELGADLTIALRLTLVVSIPAGIGLALIAEPLVALFFGHGAFSAADVARTARPIVCYSLGVWAFCALPILLRGYFACEDRATPLVWATVSLVVCIVLDLLLVWPLAEAGLALAATVSTIVQVLALAGQFHRRHGPLAWTDLLTTSVRATLAGLAMAAAVWGVMQAYVAPTGTLAGLLRVLVLVGCGGLTYAVVGWAVGLNEAKYLRRKKP